MKKLLILISLLFICLFQIDNTVAQTYTEKTAEGIVDGIVKPGDSKKINVGCAGKDCDLGEGVKETKGIIHNIEDDMTFSAFIQEKVVYILGFISIIAVIFIIYAGFVIMTSVGDEEKIKSAKKTIIFVIVGMIVIWSAYSIVLLIINGLNESGDGGGAIDGNPTIVDMTT